MGISVKRTMDKELIKVILTDENIWKDIAEDDQDVNYFEVDLESNIFLALFCDEVCMGVYILHVFNGCTLQIHANMLPQFREEHATECGEKVLDWFKDNAPEKFIKLMAYIPSAFPHVYHFTMNRGFKDEGRLTKAYLKQGKLYDIHILGLERATLTR